MSGKARKYALLINFVLLHLLFCIQLVRLLIHDILRQQQGVLTVRWSKHHLLLGILAHIGHHRNICRHARAVRLIEEFRYLARAGKLLVHGKSGPKLLVHADFDGIEELQHVGLAVVRNEVVGWLLFSDARNDGFACKW